jgi:phenylalanyl-tRNA synthetase beta chain
MSPSIYSSLIDLQEKLHHNICRKRALVAIGVHDLDTLTPPFTYGAEPGNQIQFRPLNQEKVFRADELMEFYTKDTHLKPYLHLIKDEPLFPVIRDATGTVLSLPPIINGDHSKVSMDTRNIFIECTARDETKANIVLDTLVAMLSEYAQPAFSVEVTKVIYEDRTVLSPKLAYKMEVMDVGLANRTVGIE